MKRRIKMAKIIRGYKNKDYEKFLKKIGVIGSLQILGVRKNIVFFYTHPIVGYFGYKNGQWYHNVIILSEEKKIAKDILREAIIMLEENFKEALEKYAKK